MWSTLDWVEWNAEFERGDVGKAVQRLKRQSGTGLLDKNTAEDSK